MLEWLAARARWNNFESPTRYAPDNLAHFRLPRRRSPVAINQLPSVVDTSLSLPPRLAFVNSPSTHPPPATYYVALARPKFLEKLPRSSLQNSPSFPLIELSIHFVPLLRVNPSAPSNPLGWTLQHPRRIFSKGSRGESWGRMKYVNIAGKIQFLI